MTTATTVGFIVGLLLNVSVAAQLQNVSFLNGLPENFTSDGAIDVQYTSCKVITDRIVATAEGKFSRFCHGICNISIKYKPPQFIVTIHNTLRDRFIIILFTYIMVYIIANIYFYDTIFPSESRDESTTIGLLLLFYLIC